MNSLKVSQDIKKIAIDVAKWVGFGILSIIGGYYYGIIQKANTYDDRILKIEEAQLKQNLTNYRDSINIINIQETTKRIDDRYYRDSLDRRLMFAKLSFIENAVIDLQQQQRSFLKSYFKQIE